MRSDTDSKVGDDMVTTREQIDTWTLPCGLVLVAISTPSLLCTRWANRQKPDARSRLVWLTIGRTWQNQFSPNPISPNTKCPQPNQAVSIPLLR
jgi:hypothetical protein